MVESAGAEKGKVTVEKTGARSSQRTGSGAHDASHNRPHSRDVTTDILATGKKFFIGLDESGTGECLGDAFCGACVFSRASLESLSKALVPTEVKHFDIAGLNRLLAQFKPHEKAFRVERIRAQDLDQGSKNALLDKAYEAILTEPDILPLLQDACIILDDYGVGWALARFLRAQAGKGAHVIVEHRADARYLPAVCASVRARKLRLEEMEKLADRNELTDAHGKRLRFANGGVSDPKTIAWLKEWIRKHPNEELPYFVRRKWGNVKTILREYKTKHFLS